MKKNLLFWLPRILTIVFILFLSLFALDIFGEGYGFLETIVGLFMHLIPNFVLIILLIVAWKWEKLGGILFIVLGAAFTIFFDTYENLIAFLAISLPVFVIGGLFLLNNFLSKK